jgi:hypothetical protein
MSTSANLKFVDVNGRQEHIYVSGVLSASALSTFATALIPFTSAEMQKLSFVETEIVSLQGVGSPVLAVSTLGVVYFKDLDNPGKVYRFAYPSPNHGDYEHIEQVGYLMRPDRGIVLATMYRNLTGRNVEFNEGKIT